MKTAMTRKDFLKVAAVTALGLSGPWTKATQGQPAPADPALVTLDDLKSVCKIAGLQFTDEELRAVLNEVRGLRRGWEAVRPATHDYELLPTSVFRAPGAETLPKGRRPRVALPRVSLRRPQSEEDLAFLSVVELGHLLRTRQVTSVELTQLYLKRLKTFGPALFCVAALMEDRALEFAANMDQEAAAGRWRGPLHGIPCGIKDLFATHGTPTQWGTAAFRGQMIDKDAAVVEKLEAAGAVIVAKLSLGALAMNDRWYGGMTRNPWNPEQGSSGSSAGSASAVAAALVPFAIGTETSGSIVSPSHQCRVTGFRPTFGSASRYGAMALAWSLDKVGPIARTAVDAALVMAALLGEDPRDPSTVDRPFEVAWGRDLKGIKIGVIGQPPAELVSRLTSWGAALSRFEQPPTQAALGNIVSVEAATMFDEITRSGKLNEVTENQWPQIFRAARFVTAVEYLQAERARTVLVRDVMRALEPFDFVLSPDRALSMIYPGNLVGLPQLLVPYGAGSRGEGISISLIGKPFQEAVMLRAAKLIQDQTGFPKLRPDLTKLARS